MEDYVLFMRGVKECFAWIRIHDRALNPLKGRYLNPTLKQELETTKKNGGCRVLYLCASSYLIFCYPVAIGNILSNVLEACIVSDRMYTLLACIDSLFLHDNRVMPILLGRIWNGRENYMSESDA